MLANAKALLTSKEEVFIIDWWLSPELMLIRSADEKAFRLDNILGRIAGAEVRVHVMLYKEMPFALALNSLYTKTKLVSKTHLLEYLSRVDVDNAYGTTLKLPSDIAAENEPSAGTKTVQMVTTKMAEQAGEAPIKDTYVDISESTGI
ncbi:unnamed protein product [Rotaria sp. Silwood1]|nr:unnamed protein product [Rotaria sp. Silwood1]